MHFTFFLTLCFNFKVIAPLDLSLLHSIPLLNGLPDALLSEIASNSKVLEYPSGSTVLKAGDTPGYMMIVLTGVIQLNELAEDGRVTGISYAGPTQLLAWASIIDHGPLLQSIVAVKASKLLVCPIKLIQHLVSNDVLLANRFLKLATDSIRKLEQSRNMLNLPNAYHRVFMQINLLSSDAKSGTTNLPKQLDIATSVNTSRETVSRAIQMLIKNGVLRKVGHQIVIKQADELKKLAIDGPDAISATKS